MKSITLFLLSLLLATPLLAAGPNHGAVASAHPLATAAGVTILNAGGNAFDATVAVSAALAVVEPYSSGIGGGGFWLLHDARTGRDVMVDGRERAPLAAHRDLYLDADGKVIPGLSMDGALAAGIPGEPAALVHIAERYGRLPLAQSLAPAIALARDGFPVTPHYRKMAGFRLKALQGSSESRRLFLASGVLPPLGHTIRQPELATTLEALAAKGHDGFYAGSVARRLVEGVRAAGGIWTQRDLESYRVIERRPVSGHFRGFEVVSAAPPSSGGVALIESLNILAQLPEAADLVGETHLLTETLRRAYRDRAEFLGDPDFVAVPVARLTGEPHARQLAATIDPGRATPSAELKGFAVEPGGSDTTHLSLLDRDGNYVAATLSINYPFGSGLTIAGTGVLLNDEMDDFSAKPGVANAYGLVGAEANAIAPGKRMLSSMSPTFLRNDQRVAILGTPGGSRIITMVLLGLLEAAEGRPPSAWVARPRLHHQYLPDTLFAEPGALSDEVIDGLRLRGHTVTAGDTTWGNMQAILWHRDSGEVAAASDPRGEGVSALQ